MLNTWRNRVAAAVATFAIGAVGGTGLALTQPTPTFARTAAHSAP